jgi:transposase
VCVHPVPWPEPDPQIAAAIAAKYTGKRPRPLAVQVRDRLGRWLADEEFAAAFGIRGRPGWSPSRLALVTVLQRAEDLTDRLAAEAVRTRIDWQYLLGLALDDPGFDPSIMSEFRGKVADAGLEQVALDVLLAKLAADGLIKAGGKQRTDSTHVVAAVAALNRLELAGESVRAAVEALAVAHPAWLEQRICVADWTRRYGTPMTSWRPPQSEARRGELAIACARDGYALLEAVYDPSAPPWLRELPAVDVLRRVLVQTCTRTITGGREVIRRREKEPEGDGLPPGHARIASPYDTDARWGVKREEFWLGYKLAEAQAAARAAEKTIPFQADYARRAGVEGTMHQAVSHGARRARYRGLSKTRLDHVYMACALNLLRLEAYWTGTPLDRRRTSHLARLELGLVA